MHVLACSPGRASAWRRLGLSSLPTHMLSAMDDAKRTAATAARSKRWQPQFATHTHINVQPQHMHMHQIQDKGARILSSAYLGAHACCVAGSEMQQCAAVLCGNTRKHTRKTHHNTLRPMEWGCPTCAAPRTAAPTSGQAPKAWHAGPWQGRMHHFHAGLCSVCLHTPRIPLHRHPGHCWFRLRSRPVDPQSLPLPALRVRRRGHGGSNLPPPPRAWPAAWQPACP